VLSTAVSWTCLFLQLQNQSSLSPTGCICGRRTALAPFPHLILTCECQTTIVSATLKHAVSILAAHHSCCHHQPTEAGNPPYALYASHMQPTHYVVLGYVMPQVTTMASWPLTQGLPWVNCYVILGYIMPQVTHHGHALGPLGQSAKGWPGGRELGGSTSTRSACVQQPHLELTIDHCRDERMYVLIVVCREAFVLLPDTSWEAAPEPAVKQTHVLGMPGSRAPRVSRTQRLQGHNSKQTHHKCTLDLSPPFWVAQGPSCLCYITQRDKLLLKQPCRAHNRHLGAPDCH
jgi:hypothetical protein